VILPFGDAHARAYQEKIDFRRKKLNTYQEEEVHVCWSMWVEMVDVE
jgi:hypothetical protein